MFVFGERERIICGYDDLSFFNGTLKRSLFSDSLIAVYVQKFCTLTDRVLSRWS